MESVWVSMFSPGEAARAFGLPEAERAALMMPIGYPAEGARPADRRPLSGTVRYL